MNKWDVPNLKSVLALRRDGKTFKELGECFNVSEGRIKQVVDKATREEKTGFLTMILNCRNQRAICRISGITYEDLLFKPEWVKQRIKPIFEKGYTGPITEIKNFGKKGFAEICNWAGIEWSIRLKKKCPNCGQIIRKNCKWTASELRVG